MCVLQQGGPATPHTPPNTRPPHHTPEPYGPHGSNSPSGPHSPRLPGPHGPSPHGPFPPRGPGMHNGPLGQLSGPHSPRALSPMRAPPGSPQPPPGDSPRAKEDTLGPPGEAGSASPKTSPHQPPEADRVGLHQFFVAVMLVCVFFISLLA